MASPTDWRDDAACNDTFPDTFFPNGASYVDEAREVCRSCPVVAECLADALRQRDWHGFRGGMSGEDRRKLMAGKAAKPDHTAEVVRLRALRWDPKAIALRLDIHFAVVYRILQEHRERGEAA